MHEFKRRRGGGSERRDFVNVFFVGARRYIGGREWWYAVPDAFRSTPSFYIYTFILFNQTLFKIDFWTTLLRRASSPRRRVESSSSTLYIYIYIERERERLPRLLRASLILLSSSSSSSFHRSRARRFVDGLRRAPIVVVWYFNPKVFDDCIDFPFEFFRALNLALIASLLLSAFQRG